ncbi:FAD/NAD(P)-binding domain-containing protein [Ophiobolus disseminans]|uniref:FAD/NAD(P)-binding domain-containing protein n=1 Tax=Ophiobolus disseminans TaxID=1469910 RepID=A0A6A6ZTV0_9PLEO|nr:FAD/NAD(P)-binding domain-containing protein [Ophiobolus disseminans]
MSSFKVLIIGGGLSGALLANGLLNNNIDFTIFERDHAHSKREGYQIRLGAGANAGFRVCLTDAQIQTITNKLGKSTVTASTAPALYTSQFRELIDFSAVPSDVVLAGHIEYGKAFIRYSGVERGGEEKVRVEFEDGSCEYGDVVVGADGANSRVNKQSGLNNITRIESHWSFVSKGNLPYERMMQLPAKLRQSPMVVSTKHTSMYYALYLPEDFSKASMPSAEIEKRYNEAEALFYWGVNIPVRDLPYKDILEIKDKRKVVLNHIRNWALEYHTMFSIGADDADAADLLVLKFHASSKPAADWRARLTDPGQGHARVWLMGDAIHAMQPNRGQGGNQALQDCADMLPRLLTVAKKGASTSDISAACAAYEADMIPRAFEWVKKSGGTSIPNIDFDGWVGVVVGIVAVVLVPLMQLYARVFAPVREEESSEM